MQPFCHFQGQVFVLLGSAGKPLHAGQGNKLLQTSHTCFADCTPRAIVLKPLHVRHQVCFVKSQTSTAIAFGEENQMGSGVLKAFIKLQVVTARY